MRLGKRVGQGVRLGACSMQMVFKALGWTSSLRCEHSWRSGGLSVLGIGRDQGVRKVQRSEKLEATWRKCLRASSCAPRDGLRQTFVFGDLVVHTALLMERGQG